MQPSTLVPTLFALCLVTALAPTAASSDPVAPLLVELHPNPEGPDRGNEWVELANPGPAELPLDGLFLGEGSGDTVALSGTVPAFGRVVVALPGSFALNNGGDTVTLFASGPTGEPAIVQTVAYGTDEVPAPGSGDSVIACELAAGLHGPWTAGAASPGTANAAC